MSEGQCNHEEFQASVVVNRMEDCGRFHADISIRCAQCGASMSFLGLPRGLDMGGAATNHDGTELRVAVHPAGEVVPEMALGFHMRKA